MKGLKNMSKINKREITIIGSYIVIVVSILLCNVVMFKNSETIHYYYNQRQNFYNCKIIKTNGNYIDTGTPKEFYLVITENNDTLNYVSRGHDLTTKNMISFYNHEFIEYNPDKITKQEYEKYINFNNFYTRLVSFYFLIYVLYCILFVYTIIFIYKSETLFTTENLNYLTEYGNIVLFIIMLAILFFDLFNF